MADVSAEEACDPLFKGCTRPAMIWGVPLVPLAVVTAGVILVSVWTQMILFAASLLPIVLVMRLIAKSDDQQFRLLGLKIVFRIVHYNANGRFWRASCYSPIAFKKR
jgi:type IV secretion system protein VirB3